MNIRKERETDISNVYSINASAFATQEEANLVNALRDNVEGVISLVATDGDDIVGHIMFSPVTIAGSADSKLYGLAPMAVDPKFQNRGIGSLLVKAGLEECKSQNISAVFVLGHPDYYPRFGFQPSSRFGIKSEYDVPDDVFMALELEAGVLDNISGVVEYNEVFGNL